MTKVKKYRLFALPINDDCVKRGSKERFCRITPRYILIYKTGRKPETSVEITEKEIGRLTKEDEHWLWDCNSVLLADAVKEKTPEILSGLSDKINKLETTLKKAKEETEKESHAGTEERPDSRTE